MNPTQLTMCVEALGRKGAGFTEAAEFLHIVPGRVTGDHIELDIETMAMETLTPQEFKEIEDG